MRVVMYAAIYLPCKGVEDGSWTWWLKGCWMFDMAAVVLPALIVASIGVAALWSLRQSQKSA